MSVHIQRLSNKDSNFLIRIYSGVPDGTPAYKHRLDYDAVCMVSVKPNSKIAWVYALLGEIDNKDYIDIGEELHKEGGINEVVYERARGYVIHLARHGPRKWKRVPTTKKVTLRHPRGKC